MDGIWILAIILLMSYLSLKLSKIYFIIQSHQEQGDFTNLLHSAIAETFHKKDKLSSV